MVAYAPGRNIIYIHATENTAHTEHILTFQIRAVTPAVNLYNQVIVAFRQILAQVELCHIVRALGISHIPAVDPNLGA